MLQAEMHYGPSSRSIGSAPKVSFAWENQTCRFVQMWHRHVPVETRDDASEARDERTAVLGSWRRLWSGAFVTRIT